MLFTCCLYTTAKYRRIHKNSKLSNANRTRDESEYSKSPNRIEFMYATIGMGDSNIIHSIATGERNAMTSSSPSQQKPLILTRNYRNPMNTRIKIRLLWLSPPVRIIYQTTSYTQEMSTHSSLLCLMELVSSLSMLKQNITEKLFVY